MAQEFIARHDAVAVLDQVDEHGEHLRLQCDPLPSPPQFEPAGVDAGVAEAVLHDPRASAWQPALAASLHAKLYPILIGSSWVHCASGEDFGLNPDSPQPTRRNQDMKPLGQNPAHGHGRRWRAFPPRPRRSLLAFGCVLALCSAGAVRADAVTDWNAVATQSTNPLPLPARLRAM
ncbi:MAG TPA: hypothetical protein VHL61_07055, partial [Luteimonas sp.]|nr:hypothetical protein [Luteimonas sp.]